MHDAHVHLDFITNGEDVAAEAGAADAKLFAVTVTPRGYASARERFGGFDNVRVGLGAHPWWVPSLDGEDFALLDEGVRAERFIGEIGLDLGKRHIDSRDEQVRVFSSIARACAKHGEKVISLHSVKAAAETLEVLEESGAIEACTCIFHWFTGPSDQLKRAIDAGCYFSVGPRMLATGKGREYVKAIPAKRLLLETDAPPGRDIEYSYELMRVDLEQVRQAFVAVKGEGAAELVDDTFDRIMGM